MDCREGISCILAFDVSRAQTIFFDVLHFVWKNFFEPHHTATIWCTLPPLERLKAVEPFRAANFLPISGHIGSVSGGTLL